MNSDVHENSNYGPLFNRNSAHQNRGRSGEFVEDLEDSLPGVIPTISNKVSNHVALSNGNLGGKQRQTVQNGQVQNGRPPNFRSMLDDAEMDSHI